MTIATLKITNKTSKYNDAEFNVNACAIPEIVQWYCGFCSGDNITVHVNGTEQILDGDWGLLNNRVVL